MKHFEGFKLLSALTLLVCLAAGSVITTTVTTEKWSNSKALDPVSNAQVGRLLRRHQWPTKDGGSDNSEVRMTGAKLPGAAALDKVAKSGQDLYESQANGHF